MKKFSRDGGDRRPARSGSGDRPRSDRPFQGRDERRPPRRDGEGGYAGGGERRPPRRDGEGGYAGGGERRPPRRDGEGGYAGGGERRPPRRDGEGGYAGGGERRPPRRDGERSYAGGGERRPPRRDGEGSYAGGGERRPPRRDGERSYAGGGERRAPRREGEGGYARSFDRNEERPREDRFREDRPREDRFREDRPRNEEPRRDLPREQLKKDRLSVWRPEGAPEADSPHDERRRFFAEKREQEIEAARPRRRTKDEGDAPRRAFGDKPFRDRDDSRPRFQQPSGDAQEAEEFESSVPQNAQRKDEARIYGLNACLTFFARRPQDLIRAYFTQRTAGRCNEIMKHCVENRLAYHIIPDEEMDKVADTLHHEGVCLLIKKRLTLRDNEFLAGLDADEPCTVLALEGIGNPHNLGGIARTAAHFGVRALIVPQEAPIHGGAAARVAEGGLEALTLAQFRDFGTFVDQWREAGFEFVATSSHESDSVFDFKWPKRCVIVFGEEGEGLSRFALKSADARVQIPGSGAVESLNVSCATAVVLAEWARQTAGKN